MRVAGIVGRSGSGKTTLIERLLPVFRARGMRVSTVKHTHHAVDLDPPGKDSHRHRIAGAEEVLLVSEHRWALLRETPDAVPLEQLLSRLAPVDLVLVEGFGRVPGPRLELVLADQLEPAAPHGRRRPLFLDDPGIGALVGTTVGDQPVPGWTGPWFQRDDIAAIAAWITLGSCGT